MGQIFIFRPIFIFCPIFTDATEAEHIYKKGRSNRFGRPLGKFYGVLVGCYLIPYFLACGDRGITNPPEQRKDQFS